MDTLNWDTAPELGTTSLVPTSCARLQRHHHIGLRWFLWWFVLSVWLLLPVCAAVFCFLSDSSPGFLWAEALSVSVQAWISPALHMFGHLALCGLHYNPFALCFFKWITSVNVPSSASQSEMQNLILSLSTFLKVMLHKNAAPLCAASSHIKE